MGGVIDGSSWNDKNFQSHRRSLDARFDSLWDAESPIQEFLLAAFEETGSEAYPDRKQISEWVDTGSLRAASVFFSSPLLTGRKYIIVVKAKNAAGHVATCESNGVTIDTAPPTAGTVSIMHDSIAVDAQTRWLGVFCDEFHDTESGIDVFLVSILEMETDSTIASAMLFSQGSVKFLNVKLQAGRHYTALVTARDRAGNEVAALSEAVLAASDDEYLPDASRIFGGSPTVFRTSLHAVVYIVNHVLPLL